MFRVKNRNRHFSDTRSTLDAQHQKTLAHFQHEFTNLPKKHRKLQQLQKRLDKLRNTQYSNQNDVLSSNILQQQLLSEIRDLQSDIDNIATQQKSTDYLLKTSDILTSYASNDANNKNKAQLLEQYLVATERKPPNTIRHNPKCPSCNVDLVSDLAHRICKTCGYVSNESMPPDKPSYRDGQQTEIITKFSYKRLNHLRDWLKHFQGKEYTEIPDEVYDRLRHEFQKHRLSNDDITIEKLKDFLKKLKLNRYYEHAPYMLKQLTGKDPPYIEKELEEQFIVMFMETQEPFLKHKPPNRKNFLSYSYVLHKFCELLDRDDLAAQFTLLKDREKLHEQDLVWEKICNDLGWQYIPSGIK